MKINKYGREYQRMIKTFLKPKNFHKTKCGSPYAIQYTLNKLFKKDSDRDGIKNIYDCHPYNKNLHGIEPNRLQKERLKKRKIFVTNMDIFYHRGKAYFSPSIDSPPEKREWNPNPRLASESVKRTKNPPKFGHITDKKHAPKDTRINVLSTNKKTWNLFEDDKDTKSRIIYTSGDVYTPKKTGNKFRVVQGTASPSTLDLRRFKKFRRENPNSLHKRDAELLDDSDIKNRGRNKEFRKSIVYQTSKEENSEPRSNVVVKVERQGRKPDRYMTYTTTKHEMQHAKSYQQHTPQQMRHRMKGSYRQRIEEKEAYAAEDIEAEKIMKTKQEAGKSNYEYRTLNKANENVKEFFKKEEKDESETGV